MIQVKSSIDWLDVHASPWEITGGRGMVYVTLGEG